MNDEVPVYRIDVEPTMVDELRDKELVVRVEKVRDAEIQHEVPWGESYDAVLRVEGGPRPQL